MTTTASRARNNVLIGRSRKTDKKCVNRRGIFENSKNIPNIKNQITRKEGRNFLWERLKETVLKERKKKSNRKEIRKGKRQK